MILHPSLFLLVIYLKILWIGSWWFSEKLAFLYTHAFSLSVKKYQYFPKENHSNKVVFKTPTTGPIKNANSLKFFLFYVSKRNYFHVCECGILMGHTVFPTARKKIPQNPREHGGQISTLFPLPNCTALQRSLRFCNLVVLASRLGQSYLYSQGCCENYMN